LQLFFITTDSADGLINAEIHEEKLRRHQSPLFSDRHRAALALPAGGFFTTVATKKRARQETAFL
jgi:hypothetical protein